MPWMIPGAIAGSALLSANASQNAAKTQAASADKATQAEMGMFNQTSANMSPWMQTGKLALGDLATMMGIKGSAATVESDPRFADFAKSKFDEANAAHMAKFGIGINDPRSGWAVPGEKQKFDDSVRQQFLAQNPTADGSTNSQFGMLTKPFGMSDFQESPAYQFNLSEGEKAINKSAVARGKFYAPSTLQDISKYSQGVASNEFQNAYSNYNTNMGNIWNRLSTLSGGGQNAAGNLGSNASQVAGQVGNNIIGAGNAQAAGQVGAANAISGGVGSAYNNYLMQQILAGNQQSSIPGSNPSSAGAGDLNTRFT